MSEQTKKRLLSLSEAVQVGQMIYSLNTDKQGVLTLASQCGLFLPQILNARKNHLEKNPKPLNQDDNPAQNANNPLNTHEELNQAKDSFYFEWRALVHAAVLHALSECAPAVVVVEYLRGIQSCLMHEEADYTLELGHAFVDDAFNAYTKLAMEKAPEATPKLLLERYARLDIESLNTPNCESDKPLIQGVALLSATIAMLFATCMDALEKYDYDLR